MDDLIDLLQSLMKQAESLADELSEEEMKQIFQIFKDASEIIAENQEQAQSIEAPITPGADLLWILSGSDPKSFTQYLQNFPDPALNALAKNPTQLQATINQLSQQITTPAGEAEDGIAKAPLQSSNIYGFRYDPRSSTLKVRFNSGSVYSYDGVPPNVFKMFQSAAIPAKTDGQNQYGKWWKGKSPSAGASFYSLIRDRFPYKRLR